MVTISIIALLCAAVALILRSAFSIAHVVILPATPIAFGFWMLVEEERAQPVTALWFTVSLAVLAFGYFSARRHAARSTEPQLRLGAGDGRSYVMALVLVSVFFTLLHFGTGGIPLFSHNIETRRFEFGSSLFGIPGRMYLYGVPLAAGVALARARQLGLVWYTDRLSLVSVTVLVISRLLSGFKGGLIEVLIVLMAATVLAQGPISSVARVARRYLPLAIAALIAVFLVGSLYSSYRTPGRSLSNAILARATTKAALPGALVFERRLVLAPASSISVDTAYFAKKYFSVGSGSSYSFGRLVASTIFHIGPESTAYTAPVTYGIFPEMAYDFGLPFALLIMLSLGVLLASVEALARRTTLGGYMVCLALALVIYELVNKGGLVYMLINWTAVTVMLLIVGRLGHAISSRPHHTSQAWVSQRQGMLGKVS